MVTIDQTCVLQWQVLDSARWAFSVPCWDDLARPPANRGMIRHGGVAKVEDYVGKRLKLPYPQHVKHYLNAIGDPTGATPRPVLGFGTRNTAQNLGLPAWHSQRTPRLLRRVDEPWQDWIYHGLVQVPDGQLRIEQIRFQARAGAEPDAILVGSDKNPADVNFAVTGQPILWDGEIPPLSILGACTYDLRHVYNLCWEESLRLDVATVPRDPANDKAIHDALMAAFMENLREPIETRAAALAAIANRHALPIADGYLHSSIGLTDDQRINLVIQRGSLTDLGMSHRALGSRRALLLDNGGSVGIAYWSKRSWDAAQWATSAPDSPAPLVVGCGSYFRPRGHALLIAELHEDILERPFIRRPPATTPWR